eukprot:11643575-Prorocentrum_lima.AAC.1
MVIWKGVDAFLADRCLGSACRNGIYSAPEPVSDHQHHLNEQALVDYQHQLNIPPVLIPAPSTPSVQSAAASTTSATS